MTTMTTQFLLACYYYSVLLTLLLYHTSSELELSVLGKRTPNPTNITLAGSGTLHHRHCRLRLQGARRISTERPVQNHSVTAASATHVLRLIFFRWRLPPR